MKTSCVYIMTNRLNGVIDCGVTSDLAKRAYQHRTGAADGFTKRYRCKFLVWYDLCERMDDAIAREKQLNGGSRAKKIALIAAMNSEWADLYETLNG